jgi:hypothetical protein
MWVTGRQAGTPSVLSCNIRPWGLIFVTERELFNGKKNFKIWPNSKM